MKNSRIATGIDGLDEVLLGGFRPASSYLVVGGPGTGKTVLALQFMNECARRKSPSLYLTFAEPEASLRTSAKTFGWDLPGVVFEDLTRLHAENGTQGEYSVFSPQEAEQVPVWKHIYSALEKHAPERLVIDSATYLRFLSTDAHQYRRHVQRLINTLSARGCLSLLLFEPLELEKDNIMALAVDGVVSLKNEISESRVVELRSLEIRKMRASAFLSGRHALRITSQGMAVWPHRVERLKESEFCRTNLLSGIDALDTLLGGGICSGTCTLITGPTGVGKSSAGAQFLCTAASAGIKGAIYTFEEGRASILTRCESIGIPVKEHLEADRIFIREINPLENYPDEFLELMGRDAAQNEVQVMMIDSLRGYNLAMEQFGDLVPHMHNIVNFVRNREITLFLANEQEKITGDLQITDLGVSYIADNVLFIRFAEYKGEVIRIVGCLKKRLGPYQAGLRELKITGQGIVVGEKLTGLRGLLSGMPSGYMEE